ncbi:hypothetical protein LCGC14_1256510, partial [marine sediment metagenome]
EKNKLLTEKEKETTEPTKEIREFKEEWSQYLANSIKESDISDDVKEKLSESLDIYGILKELIEKIKSNEIVEEEFKQEVKKFEYILIEESHIAKPLFMNFDWFRRYYNGMIRKAGKKVAHLYISKKTREFLSYISGRIEQLENLGNTQENLKKFKEFLERYFQIKEKWALLLNRLIRETPNKEISTEIKKELETVIKLYCEIRAIQFSKKISKEDKEKLIQGRIEKYNPRFFELFEILKRFLGIYDNYSRNWMEKSLILEGKKTVKRLSQKIESIKKENTLHQILNDKSSSIQNYKEVLKENLYKNSLLSLKEKSQIIKIIQNKEISDLKMTKLVSILSKLSAEELLSLLGINNDQSLRRTGLVYFVLDKRTGKVYVGQTIRSLRDRFAEHLRDPPNKYFREAVNFYKQKGYKLKISYINDKSLTTQNNEFIIEIIGEARSQKLLNELEITEIKNRKSCVLDYFTIKDGHILPLYGYNIQRGGNYSVLSLKGKVAITYSHIDKEQLKSLIKRGLFVSEIAKELIVPDMIIITKIQEFWASEDIFTLDQTRKIFGGYDIYKSRMKHIPTSVPNSTTFSDKRLNNLVKLIKGGYSTPQMKFELDIDNSELYLMLRALGFSTFTSARDHYGSTELFCKKSRETLINSVKRGKDHAYYVDVDEGLFISLIKQKQDYKVLAQKLKIAERTVYEKSYELLDMSLPEAERIYRIYPKLEKKLLNEKDPRKFLKTPFFKDLITSGLTVEEVDKEFLKILIALGYSKKELEGLYGWDHYRMTRWIANILKMDFYRAIEEFWWKSRIMWLFRLGYSARQMRDVSLRLIGKHVTHGVLKRVFAEEYKIHGSKTWKYLKNLYET